MKSFYVILTLQLLFSATTFGNEITSKSKPDVLAAFTPGDSEHLYSDRSGNIWMITTNGQNYLMGNDATRELSDFHLVFEPHGGIRILSRGGYAATKTPFVSGMLFHGLEYAGNIPGRSPIKVDLSNPRSVFSLDKAGGRKLAVKIVEFELLYPLVKTAERFLKVIIPEVGKPYPLSLSAISMKKADFKNLITVPKSNKGNFKVILAGNSTGAHSAVIEIADQAIKKITSADFPTWKSFEEKFGGAITEETFYADAEQVQQNRGKGKLQTQIEAALAKEYKAIQLSRTEPGRMDELKDLKFKLPGLETEAAEELAVELNEKMVEKFSQHISYIKEQSLLYPGEMIPSTLKFQNSTEMDAAFKFVLGTYTDDKAYLANLDQIKNFQKFARQLDQLHQSNPGFFLATEKDGVIEVAYISSPEQSLGYLVHRSSEKSIALGEAEYDVCNAELAGMYLLNRAFTGVGTN